MTKPIIMQQYDGDGNYDILHPETDTSMITDFGEASEQVVYLPIIIRNNGIYVEEFDLFKTHNIHELYNDFQQGKEILAVVKDYTYNPKQVLDSNHERLIVPLVHTNRTEQEVNGITYYTDALTLQIFKDNFSFHLFGTCVYRADQTDDFQDIWSWGIAKDLYENKANLTQDINASSKASQYPSAAAVYNAISGAVQMTQVTETVSGTDTECAINITDKLPHYAVIDDVTTTTCTVNITIPNDNFNEHRILIINHNANALGAQNSGAITFIGGATTAYSIPAGSMVELCFRRINAVNILTYYNFVDAH